MNIWKMLWGLKDVILYPRVKFPHDEIETMYIRSNGKWLAYTRDPLKDGTAKHAHDCDWHCDQYDWECTCGAMRKTKKPCSSYHSLILHGNCQNCGWRKEEHK